MDKKLQRLIKKHSGQDTTLLTQVYGSTVNSNINDEYKYGEEHAIMRKTIAEIITALQTLGVDSAVFQEFLTYNTYVENLKKNTKEKLEI